MPPPDAARDPRKGGSDLSATACICRDCISVDHLPSARLREVSMVAEFVASRIEVLG